MLSKMAESLTRHLRRHNVINEEDTDIYVYGLELLLSFFFSVSIIMLLGILLNSIFETILFLSVFIFLRCFSGGFHAKTYWMCSLVTFSTYGISLLFSKLVSIHLIGYIILFVIGTVILAIFAPIEHPNKKLSQTQKKKFKIWSIVLFITFISAGILMRDTSAGSVIFFSLISDIILLFIKNKKQEE